MPNSEESRYSLAVYLVVILLAIILLLLGFLTAEHKWQTVWLNLSTELLGAVIIFFLITWLFRLQYDADLSACKKKIEELEEYIEQQAQWLRDTTPATRPTEDL